MIKVIVNGAKGKMGQTTVDAVLKEAELELVAQLDQGDSLEEAIQRTKADVVIDFTHPSIVKENARRILSAGSHAVIGTTGLSQSDLKELDQLAKEKNKAITVCPNFAIGAILMMKAAVEIAHYMPHVEIIELHHDKKADAPSGTALKTAEMILEKNPNIATNTVTETEILPGARGGVKDQKIHIHSVRLPGYVAHQEVIFGGLGQTLTLRHDSISRESFMPGVMLAAKKISERTGLVYGLENFL